MVPGLQGRNRQSCCLSLINYGTGFAQHQTGKIAIGRPIDASAVPEKIATAQYMHMVHDGRQMRRR